MKRITKRIAPLYHDLVNRRTVVRVIESSGEERFLKPIFIISPYRSGTTVLRLVLDSHSQLAVPGETTFLSHFDKMLSDQTALAGFEALGLDRQAAVRQIADFASKHYTNYALSCGKSRWGDKSPEYVWHWRFIHEMFPDAQFVVLVRHLFGQVASHIRSSHDLEKRLSEFREHSDFGLELAAARYWASATREQIKLIEALPESTTTLRYEDLVGGPEASVKRMLEELGLAWEPQVLEFGRFEHDYGLADSGARMSRAIRTPPEENGVRPGASRDAMTEIGYRELNYFGYSTNSMAL